MGLFDWLSILAGGPGDVSAKPEQAPPGSMEPPVIPLAPKTITVGPVATVTIQVTPIMIDVGVQTLRARLRDINLDNYHPHLIREIIQQIFEAMILAAKEP